MKTIRDYINLIESAQPMTHNNHINEPVAKVTEHGIYLGPLGLNLKVGTKLYIHPVKELTSDMLWELAEKHLDTDHPWGESNVTGIGDFIEAILRKAQER
jgi:hypothetical protein